MPTTCQLNGHPAQDWLASHAQYDNGRLDGFVESGSGPVSMGYWQQADLPFYYSLARQFPIADRYFCSVLGQTYPNRRYLIAATSIGQVDDTAPGADRLPGQRDHLRPARRARHHLEGLLHQPGHAASCSRRCSSRTRARRSSPSPGSSPTRRPAPCPASAWWSRSTAPPTRRTRRTSPGARRSPRRSINAVMAGPGLGAHAADLDVRRARRLLRPRAAAPGGAAGHHPARPCPPGSRPTTGSAGTGSGCRPRSCPRGPARYYVSHRVFDHTSILQAGGDQVEPARDDLPGRQRREHARHARPAAARVPPPPRLAAPLLSTDPAALACDASGPGVIPPPGSVTGRAR